MSDFVAQPAFLLLLPLAVVVAWRHLRRRRPALRFPDATLFAGLPVGRAARAKWGGAVLRGLILIALILAAANPRQPDLRTRVPVDGIAIALVLDVSNSMSQPDFGTPGGPPVTRLAAAKQAFRLFVAGGTAPDGTPIDGRPNDQIALVTFAAVPQTTCPLTLNHTVLLKVLDEQQTLQGIDAGTNIGDALAEALIRLDAAGNRPKLVVLLSDGEHNKSGEVSLLPMTTAGLAKQLGVPIHTIDCGGDGPTMTPEDAKQRADGRATLDAVAGMTGGRSFVADSGDELRTVLKSIDDLSRQPAPAPRYRRYHDYGVWCGLTAAGLLAALVLLERTRWRTIP
jgi:Ca-activated chloride channel homolog